MMLNRVRCLSRLQKIFISIVAVILLCGGCSDSTTLPPSSDNAGVANVSTEVAEAEHSSNSNQVESVTENEEEPTNTPPPPSITPEPTQPPQPTHTPKPSNTPLPTNTPAPSNTPRPTQTATNEPQTGEIILDSGETVTGDLATVTRIIDGDTIEVEINGQSYRVRYIGMDTPERGDPFFSEATAANQQMVEGQTVTLVKDVSETDRYGRLLRYVYLSDGTFVNAELIKQGYALVATYPPDVKHQTLFVQLQQEARNAGSGLWNQPIATLLPATLPPLPSPTPLPVQTATASPLPTNTPEPLPTAEPIPPTEAAPPPANCDPSYPSLCIPPPPPDLDCGQIPYRNFQVVEPDPHGFDRDNDGIGCES